MLQAIVDSNLHDTQVLWDQHGSGGIAAGWGEEARDWTSILSLPNPNSMEGLSKQAGTWVKTVMLEENGGGCGLSRALGHVSNSLTLQRIGHQVIGQAAAGAWWSGGDGATNADYQIKYLADRFVRAPFWHAQKMLSSSHQPNIVGGFHFTFANTSANTDFVDWMAAVSDDGNTLVIRVENPTSGSIHVQVAIVAAGTGSDPDAESGSADPDAGADVGTGAGNGVGWKTAVAVETLSGSSLDATNDYATPDNVSPINSTVALSADGKLSATLVPFSFTIFTLSQH
jgi:hypothetical protein